MSTSEFKQDSLDLLDSKQLLHEAGLAVREHQEKLRTLNERAKSLFQDWIEEHQAVQASLQRVANRLNEAHVAKEASGESAREIELASCQEEQQVLTQRSLWLSERLVSLQQTMQYLRWLTRNAEIASQFTESEFDPQIGDDDQLSKIAQMRALRAQEVERQRLAREIHDGPAQALANAIFELEYCELLLSKDPKALAKELLRLKQDIREGLADVRGFIFDLRPAPRAETGLPTMLREYVDNFHSRFAIKVDAEIADVGRYPVGQETAIYRIVQEALQNVKKHSHASEVKLRLGCKEGALEVTVEDDGVGFDINEPSTGQVGHFGLTSMRERSQLIGGRLRVESALGKGTRVVLTVPLNLYTEEA